MWKVENYAEHEVKTWYSEEEYKSLENKLAKYKEILYNIYEAEDTCTPIEDIEDFIEDEEILEELKEKRDREFKKLTERSLNAKSAK